MRNKYIILLLAAIGGMLFWIIDAAFGSMFFYKKSFWDLLILEVPAHALYIRVSVFLILLTFGWFLSSRYHVLFGKAMGKMRGSLAELDDSGKQLETVSKQLTASQKQLKNSERELLASKKILERSNYDLGERVRELNCIYSLFNVAEKSGSSKAEELLERAVGLVPSAWQDSSIICARIVFEGKEFKTSNYKETKWKLAAPIKVFGEEIGTVEVFYKKNKPEFKEHKFHHGKKILINALGQRLGKTIEGMRAEEAMRSSEMHYRRMAANVPGLVYQFFMSPDGFISFSFVSESCRDLFAIDPADIRKDADRFLSLIYPEDLKRFYNSAREAARTLSPWIWEGRITVRGEEGWFRSISRPERQANGDMLWDGLIMDVTERRKVEQAQRLAQLGKLISHMAHEVNNPLQIVSGRAELSLMEAPENEGIRENLKIVVDQCERAKGIIQRLLMFSKPSRGEMHTVNINETIDFMINLVEHSFTLSDITIVKNFAKDLPSVKVDGKQIEEVFMNLLRNAAEAIGEKGTITISTAENDDKIQIDFTDTGLGISQDDIEKIFEPFFTTKEKGTGLGLSVCFGIIKAHGGDIKYKSKLGQGTTATVLLPINSK